MGYASKHGRRPYEYASKSSHTFIINDASVQRFLGRCTLPRSVGDVHIDDTAIISLRPVIPNPIQHVIAIDGGYSEIQVKNDFPSALIAFFQFGALIFAVEDLDQLSDEPFIDPDEMQRLKRIQRLKLTLPIKNVSLKGETTLTASVRRALFEFFLSNPEDDDHLISTLRWLVFEEYDIAVDYWTLANCPSCRHASVRLDRKHMSASFVFTCPSCGRDIYLTDVFRLHEVVDDELGASGLLAYLTTAIEQLILVHLIRIVLSSKPALLREIIFIKDGPLAFFGQTANMHKPMRQLVKYLFEHHDLNLAGLEKSGAFVEHAHEMASRLPGGSILPLTNQYIYDYIIPGEHNEAEPYGRTTYYSQKVIFKTRSEQVYVVGLPSSHLELAPREADYVNLHRVLTNVEKLRCDMYDDSLIPVTLVNKLISLANHPSSKILQRFAIGTMAK